MIQSVCIICICWSLTLATLGLSRADQTSPARCFITGKTDTALGILEETFWMFFSLMECSDSAAAKGTIGDLIHDLVILLRPTSDVLSSTSWHLILKMAVALEGGLPLSAHVGWMAGDCVSQGHLNGFYRRQFPLLKRCANSNNRVTVPGLVAQQSSGSDLPSNIFKHQNSEDV